MKPQNAVVEGMEFRVPYPFVRSEYSAFDGEGYSTIKTWKPGVVFEERFIPPDDMDTDSVAEGVGEMILTVVSVHKPGRFPTRVFFTRRWKTPVGTEFGKSACRCVTIEKFRRLAKGYAHEFVVRDLKQKAA